MSVDSKVSELKTKNSNLQTICGPQFYKTQSEIQKAVETWKYQVKHFINK